MKQRRDGAACETYVNLVIPFVCKRQISSVLMLSYEADF